MNEPANNTELESLRVLFDDAGGMAFADAMLSAEVLSAVGDVEAESDPLAVLAATEVLMALLKRLTAPRRNVILQNRDRSTPAMIAQMNAIAAAPDYFRVAPTREFASGAPIVFGNDDLWPSKIALGRKDKAVAANGQRFRVQYAVVEATDLLTSNSADGIADATYTNGVPGKLRAIAGNGRLAGLKAGYVRGTAGEYRRELAEDDLTGITPGEIEKFDAPILVRIMHAEDVTENIGDISNQRGTSDLSPVEQAQNDATRLDLSDLDISDDGKPTEAAALAFIAAMPESERNNLMDGKHPGAKAYDRLMAAVFWKAYGDGELVRLYAQSVDAEIKTILGGMANAAGELARLDGAGDLDIRGVVTEAANLAINAKRQGVKLADFSRQTDMTLSPDVMEVVRMFVENIRSAKKIGERLRDAARFAYEEFTKEDTDMFGTVEKATRAQVLDRLSKPVDNTISMFDSVDPLRAIELSGELMTKSSALQAVGDNDPMEALTLADEIMAIIRELEAAEPEPAALTLAERIERARELGAQAFADGKEPIPAKDSNVSPLLAGLPVGSGASEILTAWHNGWHAANAAAPVAEPEPVIAAPIEPPAATRGQGMKALERLTAFMPRSQRTVIASAMTGEESQHFIDMMIEWANVIDTMPGTYDTDGMGLSAPARLHYFRGGSDWYITEKDKSGNGTRQAFGLTILNGDLQNAELGYISIDELVRNGVEFDLYWNPKPVGTLKNPDWTPEPDEPLDAGKTQADEPPVMPDPVASPVSDATMQAYIAIAADSIDTLRRIDVYRVLNAVRADNVDGVTRAALASWIVANRPDLLQEVTDVMAEEFPGDGWTPAAPTTVAEPAAALEQPLPPGSNEVPPAASAPAPAPLVPPTDNQQRDADMQYFADVAAGKVDMWDDGLADKLEAMIGNYAGDDEATAAWTQAVNAYTNFMVKAMSQQAA